MNELEKNRKVETDKTNFCEKLCITMQVKIMFNQYATDN